MGSKVYFRDEEKAHDFSDRIGAGGVEREEKGVSVDTNYAKFDEDDNYGEEHKEGKR